MTKNRRDLIFAIVSAVCGVVALIALALPVYIPKEELGEHLPTFSLADLTFGYKTEHAEYFKLSILYLVPFILEIAGVLLIIPQFFDDAKFEKMSTVKQIARIASMLLFVCACAVYMAARGDAYVAAGGSGTSKVLKETYNLSCATVVAGIAAGVAGIAQLAIFEMTRREKKKQ